MKIYKVISDIENIYQPNSIITSKKENNANKSIEEAITFITDAWNIQLEEI